MEAASGNPERIQRISIGMSKLTLWVDVICGETREEQ